MNEYEVGARFNIAETCVDSVSPDALFALTGTDKAQFLSDFCTKRLTCGDIVGSDAGASGGARRKGAGRHAVRQKNRKGGNTPFLFFSCGMRSQPTVAGHAVSGSSGWGSRSVMLFRLMPRVDILCSSADVVGGRMPATPSTIREKLKPTMKR